MAGLTSGLAGRIGGPANTTQLLDDAAPTAVEGAAERLIAGLPSGGHGPVLLHRYNG